MPLTHSTWWLGRIVGGLSVLSLAALSFALFVGDGSKGRTALGEYRRTLDEKLAFLRARLDGRQVVIAQSLAILVSLMVALFCENWFLALPVVPVAVFPRLVLDRLSASRVQKLEQQIEPWLNAIANALKASPSLGEALLSSLPLVAAPMSEEVDTVMKEYALGTPLDRALSNLADRVESRTLGSSVLALQIARRSGGNLPEVLENAAAALREMARLEGVVRTKTAEGKAQAVVIGILPVPLVYGIDRMDSRFFEPLFHSAIGQVVIGGAVVLWLLSILSTRKILTVDI